MKRIIAAGAALLLATVGGLLLFSYVSSADARAMEGVETVTVMVAGEPILEGTPAEQLEELVSTEAVPAKLVIKGAVTNLSELAGMVATTDLQPGEQLLQSRFDSPEALLAAGEFQLPEEDQDKHQVTIALEAQRALGGHIAAGDRVGVFVSAVPDGDEGGNMTHLTLHKVLVTRVEGGVGVATDEGEGGESPAPPVDMVLVTLALEAADAEKVVFAAEHATVWLSAEPEGASEDGTGVVVLVPPDNGVTPPNDGRNVYE